MCPCSVDVLRSKWYFLPSLVTTAVLDGFVLVSGYFLYDLLRSSACTTVRDNVVLPFIGTIPFVFLSKSASDHCYHLLAFVSTALCKQVRLRADPRRVFVSVGIVGPYGYIAHNTWGTGDWFPDVVAAEKDPDQKTFKNPLA